MTPEKIIELAKAAGFSERYGIICVRHSSGGWVGINGEIEDYTEAVIKQHTEELLKDVGEPVRHEFDRDGKWAAYYTAEQVAAAVARQKAKASDNYEVLAKRIVELDGAVGYAQSQLSLSDIRIATLEVTLKAALDALDELMEFQVKHMKVWNNPAYDIAHKVSKQIKEVLS